MREGTEPLPVIFEPIFKPRPWGGRALEHLLKKRLPPDEPIGESWELVSLPGDESRVRGGPLAGKTLSELVAGWNQRLLGDVPLVEGRFPLLIKFLDAAENLSVQVHPRPTGDRDNARGVKHEAWIILAARPGAQIYVGPRPGATATDFRIAANTPAIVDLLRAWPVSTGDSFYLPSGTPHALGAGVVVAEVQTPSDVTHRLYDWGRVGLDGKPRALHIEQALTNLRCDVPEEHIVQPPQICAGPLGATTRLARCERFAVDRLRLSRGLSQPWPQPRMAIWIVVSGRGKFRRGASECPFSTGDVVLIPADNRATHIAALADCDVLEVTVPTRDRQA